MHEIEPYHAWSKYYDAAKDRLSPFFGKNYNYEQFSDTIYGYYIDPAWDNIGSETLYMKILFADYDSGVAIFEMFGEWNDALHNDIMHLKRNIIDHFNLQGINRYILIGENVFNFHGSDDSYYEEWFEDVEDGWIAAVNFRDFVQDEWRKFNVDNYVNCGGTLDMPHWRTLKPHIFIEKVDQLIQRRLA